MLVSSNMTNRISKTLNINISLLVLFVFHSASRYVHLVDANNFESRSVERYILYSALSIRRALVIWNVLSWRRRKNRQHPTTWVLSEGHSEMSKSLMALTTLKMERKKKKALFKSRTKCMNSYIQEFTFCIVNIVSKVVN